MQSTLWQTYTRLTLGMVLFRVSIASTKPPMLDEARVSSLPLSDGASQMTRNARQVATLISRTAASHDAPLGVMAGRRRHVRAAPRRTWGDWNVTSVIGGSAENLTGRPSYGRISIEMSSMACVGYIQKAAPAKFPGCAIVSFRSMLYGSLTELTINSFRQFCMFPKSIINHNSLPHLQIGHLSLAISITGLAAHHISQ